MCRWRVWEFFIEDALFTFWFDLIWFPTAPILCCYFTVGNCRDLNITNLALNLLLFRMLQYQDINCETVTVWSGPHWHHWRAASFFSTRDLGVYIDADMSVRTHVTVVVRACFAALCPERATISVTTWLADLGSCTDCQQGGLLQLGSRWYPRPSARPAVLRLECRRPFVFLSKAVRTHNPIASWTPLVVSSGASHIPAVRSGLPLSSWNSAGVPCWESAPDIWRRHSTSFALCWLSHAGGTIHQTFNTRWPCLPIGFGTCVEQTAVVCQECTVVDDVPSRAEDCTFPVVVWHWQ